MEISLKSTSETQNVHRLRQDKGPQNGIITLRPSCGPNETVNQKQTKLVLHSVKFTLSYHFMRKVEHHSWEFVFEILADKCPPGINFLCWDKCWDN